MANTFVLIASNTLSNSSTTQVTFSSIPQTYTDLVLKMSTRVDNAVENRVLYVEYNGVTSSTLYSITYASASGSTLNSSRATAQDYIDLQNIPAGLLLNNTFNNSELYIPSYTASINKPVSYFSTSATNSTLNGNPYIYALAGLWRNTTAITSIKVYLPSFNFLSGSSFFLYGIKNS